MSSDPLVQKLIQNQFGDVPTCDQFRISACMAMYINGEFNATAQIDVTEGGPRSIQGATIYAGALSDDDTPMFCQGTIGPPMDHQNVMNLAIPVTLGTSSTAITLSGPTKVLVVVAVSYGQSEADMKTCVMSQVVDVVPHSAAPGA